MLSWLGNLARGTGAAAAKFYFNQAYAKYGQMTELVVDKENRRIDVTFLLAGEKEPIRIVLQGYAFAMEGERATISFERVETSREWMTAAAQDYACRKPFPLPPLAAKAMVMVM